MIDVMLYADKKKEQQFRYIIMNKRISQKKLNGQILLKQAQLMSKFSTIEPEKRQLDELGFAVTPPSQEHDALLNLISKSKNITQQHAQQIQHVKKIQQKKQSKVKREGEGTFLTGLGMASEQHKRVQTSQTAIELPEQNDPNLLLKDLIVKQNKDDLQQLRKMIRQTSSNLQGCSRKLNKNKKSIMQIADRYTNQVPFSTLNVLNRYQQFDAGRIQQQQYYCGK